MEIFRRLYLCCSVSLFSLFQFPCFFIDFSSSTFALRHLLRLFFGGLPGHMVDLSGNYDRRAPPSHLRVQYLECYSAYSVGHCFASIGLVGDPKDILVVHIGCMPDTAMRAWIKL